MGKVFTGKVTGITKFGAFVTIAPGKSGLVHISEIANSYVNNVSDYLTAGQEVSVKIIGIDENGRINFSIKQAAPKEEKPQQKPASRTAPPPDDGDFRKSKVSEDSSFEDKLKRFMQDSDSKISGIKMYSDKRISRRGSGRGGR